MLARPILTLAFVVALFTSVTYAFQTPRQHFVQHPTRTLIKTTIGIQTCRYRETISSLSMVKDSEAQDISTPFDKPGLAILDFLSIFLFAAVGKASHNNDGSLDIAAILTTAFPFLFAWYTTSPLTKVYGNDAEGSIIQASKLAAKGWMVAIPLGICFRGILKGYVPPLPFVIVTMITTLIVLAGSRMIYCTLNSESE
jgi:hypothetical protein